MSEISSPRPLPSSPPVIRSTVTAADLAVRLLQPLEGMLAAGESAKAEVVAIREQAQSFQLLLKLTLDGGKQTTLQAESPRPLAQGSALLVTALSDTRLALALQAGGDKPLTSLDLQQLPLGTLVQGKVVSRDALPTQNAQPVYRLLVNLLNTPLAGSQLALDSPLELPLGSLLSAQVQGSQNLAFLPLSGRLDQLVLGQQLAAQQNRQASLEGLFKGLQNLSAGDDALRGSIDKLLGALPDSSQLSTAKGLAQALESSGVLLEAKLLQGQTAALPQDLKANLLRLIAQLMPQLPGGAGALAGLQNALNQNLPTLARQLLGVNATGGSARQQALTFPLPSRLLQNMDGEADLETLLKLAAAAVSRLQTHQLSSLAQTQVDANGNLVTTWQLELPMRHQQEVIPLQVKLQREDSGKAEKAEQKDTLWKVELAFELDHLGPLQVRAQLLRGSLSSQLWAERADTTQLINAELGHLRERLQAAGLEVGELACSQGMPPQGPKTSLEQRWVDETA
ncbi:flagellar hook-length control protein FliK [Ectopseudomonas khazarica]|uniref:flagellar hook-length control protein FliK n=1 Tax=Ectopseudomonas khazarica TaxID=2502979 RepID=UPI00055E0A6A|nr:flagellar hook-length control protein FliK [Pseudomonas khazarica]QTS84823.1 flagellar hook-length control protein FliK [Pseudomonas khazarica]HIQ44740.1 flagellar hook-length control protein FliK [Pseudomonas oleovorans]